MQYFFSSILLGLSTSAVCAATCFPVYIPFSVPSAEKKPYLPITTLFAGRFIAYIAIGAVSGALGGTISKNIISYLSSIAIFILAGLLFFRTSGCFSKELHACGRLFRFSEKIHSPFFVGLLTGLNICYPFLIAVSSAAQAGSALTGVVIFAGFFTGTSMLFFPLFFIPLVHRTRFREYALKLASVVACVLALFYMAKALQVVFPKKTTAPAVAEEDLRNIFPRASSITSVKDADPPHYIAYKKSGDQKEVLGYAVTSASCGVHIQGYGGEIPVLLALSPDGRILGLKILENNETPSYVSYLFSDDFLKKFRGKSPENPLKIGSNIDAVTGATVSLTALAKTVGKTTRIFNENILNQRIVYGEQPGIKLFDLRNIAVIVLFLASILVLLYRIRFRILFLAVTLVFFGFVFRYFISIADMVKISFGLTGSPAEYPYRYVIIGLVLITTLLFGRHYCSYICPYGALQELVYFVSPVKRSVSEGLDFTLRKAKYILLFLVPVVYALTRDFSVLNFEPFQITFNVFTSFTFFMNLVRTNVLFLFFIFMIITAFFIVERFFCLYLCPLGALFAILSSIKIFSKKIFMRKGYTCAGCSKGLPDFEPECFICGGIHPAGSPDNGKKSEEKNG